MRISLSGVQEISICKVPRYTITLFYVLKQNGIIVPGEIHKSYPGRNIYRKDLKFLDRSSEQIVQIEISLLLRNRSY